MRAAARAHTARTHAPARAYLFLVRYRLAVPWNETLYILLYIYTYIYLYAYVYVGEGKKGVEEGTRRASERKRDESNSTRVEARHGESIAEVDGSGAERVNRGRERDKEGEAVRHEWKEVEKWTQEGKAKKSRRTVKNGTAAGRRVAGMEGGESVERHQRREKESRWRTRWMKGGVTKKRRGRDGDVKEWGKKRGTRRRENGRLRERGGN